MAIGSCADVSAKNASTASNHHRIAASTILWTDISLFYQGLGKIIYPAASNKAIEHHTLPISAYLYICTFTYLHIGLSAYHFFHYLAGNLENELPR